MLLVSYRAFALARSLPFTERECQIALGLCDGDAFRTHRVLRDIVASRVPVRFVVVRGVRVAATT